MNSIWASSIMNIICGNGFFFKRLCTDLQAKEGVVGLPGSGTGKSPLHNISTKVRISYPDSYIHLSSALLTLASK